MSTAILVTHAKQTLPVTCQLRATLIMKIAPSKFILEISLHVKAMNCEYHHIIVNSVLFTSMLLRYRPESTDQEVRKTQLSCLTDKKDKKTKKVKVEKY